MKQIFAGNLKIYQVLYGTTNPSLKAFTLPVIVNKNLKQKLLFTTDHAKNRLNSLFLKNYKSKAFLNLVFHKDLINIE